MRVCFSTLLLFFGLFEYNYAITKNDNQVSKQSIGSRAQDSLALVAIYNSTTNEDDPNYPFGWFNDTNWKSDAPISEWYGVGLNSAGRVDSLNLVNNELCCVLPSEIGSITELRYLDLSNNGITGRIPDEIGQLSKLEYLNLDNTGLEGPIPVEIGNLVELEFLHLEIQKGLSTRIPIEIGNLIKLKYFYFSHSNLEGSIPESIGNLTQLIQLDLSNSNLSGAIPNTIGNLKKLEYLRLQNNNLSENIPSEVGHLTALKDLNLQANSLTGAIPPEIQNLKTLESLYLNDNYLSAPIPVEIGALENLRILALYRNSITGNIPPEIGNLKNIEFIWAYQNQITGNVIPELFNLLKVEQLNLSRNKLEGEVPPEIKNAKINTLELSNNNLSGPIPKEIGESEIGGLDLSNNNFTGNIPPEIGNLSSAWMLSLSNNNFTGSIPVELGKLTNCQYLMLNGNQLTGKIPDIDWRSFSQLSTLDLSINLLTGTIPLQLGQSFIYSLNLSYNYLEGELPKELFNSNYSYFEILNLSHNYFSGSVPDVIKNLNRIQELYLNSNQFAGLPDMSSMTGSRFKNFNISANNIPPADIEKNRSVITRNTGQFFDIRTKENGTDVFLDFAVFKQGEFLGDGMFIGDYPPDSLPSIEIKFGQGSQKAHRFSGRENTFPNGGINYYETGEKYDYLAYDLVPFQVWDTLKNQKLMVSYKDHSEDGEWNLNEFAPNASFPPSREYIVVHNIPYSDKASDIIAQHGGFAKRRAYFIWPVLKHGATFDKNNVPIADLLIKVEIDSSGTIKSPTNIEPIDKVGEHKLYQNYPNPFNPNTKINYYLSKPVNNFTIEVYNILGKKVGTLLNANTHSSGEYSIDFDASGFANGVYIYRLKSDQFTDSKKMILVK